MAAKGFSSSASRRLKKGGGKTAEKIRSSTSGRYVAKASRARPTK